MSWISMERNRLSYLLYFFRGLLTALGVGFLLAGQSAAQSGYSFCQPELIHFTRQTYGAYNQNWGAVQHRQTRFLYFANSKGLLEFDGSSWRVYELPKKQKVRSVCVDEKGRIFTGALGEFGYWEPDKTGELTYHSLAPLVKDQAFQGEEIWNILVTSQGILFQSFAFIYRFHAGRIQLLHPPGNILFVRQVRNRLLLGVIDKGLYEIQGDRFLLVKGSEFLGSETVNTILPLGETELLIGTERALYRYDDREFRPFNDQLNAFMLQNRLNRGLLIGPDQYAFGTLLNGVIITDASGTIRYHINQKNGLQNSTVLSMCQDAEHNLWLGLDKGIDLINLNSPIRYFPDNDGDFGTLYDMARFNNNLYLGTNQGVYYKSLLLPESPFRLVSGTQGQVWDLTVVDNQLLCGHNRGTFRIDGDRATLLCPITGGWVLRPLKHHPDVLIQGTYTRLCIYRKDARGQWAFAHTIDGFSAAVRQLEESPDGSIWVNRAPNQGLQRLTLSADLRSVKASNVYAGPELVRSTINLCRIQEQIVVTSAKGGLRYDTAADRFVPAQSIYPWFVPTTRKVFPIDSAYVFVLRQDGSLYWGKPNQQSLLEIPVKPNQWVEEYESIVSLDENHVALCRENGFTLLPIDKLNQAGAGSVRPPIIRTIAVLDGPESSHTFRGPAPALSFSHKQGNLLITFCTPYYSRPVKYSYWLENSTQHWSPWTASQQKEFTNLSPGHYVFHLKSNLNPSESVLVFDINPPWYWTTWSKLLYVLIAGALLKWIYELHLRRVAMHQNRVREKLEEQLRHQEEQSQREIILLQKEQLEQGLIQKSEELANSTMSLIQKNELLIKLKDELGRIRARAGTKLPADDFQRINTLIDANMSSEQDWKLFQANFNKVHEQFLKHLIDNYPDLSQGDLKLAAYLRMNLSTKEIAHLLNITPRSVELKRYRLRKKLDIEGDINLSEFMMKY